MFKLVVFPSIITNELSEVCAKFEITVIECLKLTHIFAEYGGETIASLVENQSIHTHFISASNEIHVYLLIFLSMQESHRKTNHLFIEKCQFI